MPGNNADDHQHRENQQADAMQNTKQKSPLHAGRQAWELVLRSVSRRALFTTRSGAGRAEPRLRRAE